MIKSSQANNSPAKATLYYVQITTHNGSRLFSLPVNLPEFDSLQSNLSSAALLAQIAADELLLAATHRGITVKQWAVLPDSIHAFVLLQTHGQHLYEGAGKPRLLTAFIAGFKAATAKRINLLRNQPGAPVWQRSYQALLVEEDRVLAQWQATILTNDGIVVSSERMPQ
ncbi:MAG: hypothetical protein WBA76_16310 [Phormidesmis sp.]